ncbi:MAG: T9SS type A sorting domain-containing protein [Flavobacteriales bacterium]
MKDHLPSKKAGAISALGYTSMATALIAVAPHVDAQVVYVDIDPDLYLFHNTYAVDFDGDGTVDQTITQGNFSSYASSGTTSGSQFLSVQVPPGNAVLGSGPGSGNVFVASRLGPGDAIAPGDTNFHAQAQGNLAILANSLNWGGQTGFLGCRFVGGDGMDHYGWVQLSCGSYLFNASLMDYAYDIRPNTGIIAGDMGITSGLADGASVAFTMDIMANPASDFIAFRSTAPLPGLAHIELLDAQGRLVLRSPFSEGTPIDVANMPPGLYAWRCITAAGPVAQGKVVIE